MKNNQKGFIVPLLIAVIALLAIGGGIYVYNNKKTEAPAVVDTGTQQTNAQTQKINQSTTLTPEQQKALEDAYTKGKNASIMAEMSTLRSIGLLIYQTNHSYVSFCSNGLINVNAYSNLSAMVQNIIDAQKASSQSTSGITCVSNPIKYAIQILFAKKLTGDASSFCIDSAGNMGDNRKLKLNSTTLSCQSV